MVERLSYSARDGIATIVMDDGKVNVMSPAMQEELHGALDKAESDGAIVVLVGREGVFSAGFDLTILRGGGTAGVDMVRGGFELALRVRSFPTPVVVACTGHAIAMGAFLLLSGDYRIGATGAYKLTANEVAIGIPVPHAAIEIVRQRLTPSAFDRAVCLADVFGPEEGVEAGFLDRVVAPDRVVASALEHAQELQGLDLAAHAATKHRSRAAALDALRAAIARDDAEAAS